MIIFGLMGNGAITLRHQTTNDMKNIFLILAIAGIAASVASGKVIRRQLSIFQGSVPETETLAPETMEFVYDYRWCVDTTASLEDNYDSDNMLLQIGPGGLSKLTR